jgi:hypothetical protein
MMTLDIYSSTSYLFIIFMININIEKLSGQCLFFCCCVRPLFFKFVNYFEFYLVLCLLYLITTRLLTLVNIVNAG